MCGELSHAIYGHTGRPDRSYWKTGLVPGPARNRCTGGVVELRPLACPCAIMCQCIWYATLALALAGWGYLFACRPIIVCTATRRAIRISITFTYVCVCVFACRIMLFAFCTHASGGVNTLQKGVTNTQQVYRKYNIKHIQNFLRDDVYL